MASESDRTALTRPDPCVDAALMLKFVGVRISSCDDALAEISDVCVPISNRCVGRIQLMKSIGPVPMLRMIGAESPSTSSSKLSNASETDPTTQSAPAQNSRPSYRVTTVGQPR